MQQLELDRRSAILQWYCICQWTFFFVARNDVCVQCSAAFTLSTKWIRMRSDRSVIHSPCRPGRPSAPWPLYTGRTPLPPPWRRSRFCRLLQLGCWPCLPRWRLSWQILGLCMKTHTRTHTHTNVKSYHYDIKGKMTKVNLKRFHKTYSKVARVTTWD